MTTSDCGCIVSTPLTRLVGPRIDRPGSDLTRVPMLVDLKVREELREFLYLPFMRGVGYSEFIKRAIDRAREEAERMGHDALNDLKEEG